MQLYIKKYCFNTTIFYCNSKYVCVLSVFTLDLPEHNVILEVKTRWNSLFLMVERFMEQFDAIQAAALDQRLRKPMEKDR